MPYYNRVLSAINTALPCLIPSQAANLALLVSAILIKQSLCLTQLARAIPTRQQRRVHAPKHDLLHRLKRLWRFAVQLALIPYTLSSLGRPLCLPQPLPNP